MEETKKQIADFKDKLASLNKTFAECCEFYMIDKNDEKATSS